MRYRVGAARIEFRRRHLFEENGSHHVEAALLMVAGLGPATVGAGPR